MNRRDFLVNTCGACLGLTGLSTTLSACHATRYLSGTLSKDGLTIHKKDFRKGKNKYHSFVIIRHEALQYPVYVYRFGDDQYSAVWMRCTHQGTELQASGDFLQCPAHGSEFNNRGQVTNGPADDNLRSFPVTIINDALFIDLRKK